MKKLTKDQKATLEDLQGRIASRQEELENAISAYNSTMREQWEAVQTAEAALIETIEEADGFRNDVSSEMRGYYDDKSEKWQAGDEGSNYEAWIQEWENLELDLGDIEQPSELEAPESVLENLEALNTEFPG